MAQTLSGTVVRAAKAVGTRYCTTAPSSVAASADGCGCAVHGRPIQSSWVIRSSANPTRKATGPSSTSPHARTTSSAEHRTSRKNRTSSQRTSIGHCCWLHCKHRRPLRNSSTVFGHLRSLQNTVVIVLAKRDLQDDATVAEFRTVYEQAGYDVLEVSAMTGEGIGRIRELLADGTTLLSGNSGVGKSTLIGTIDPRIDIRTGEISQSHGKGRHTTTFSTMYVLTNSSAVIDTPGIKGIRVDRHRRCRTVALLSGDDAHSTGLPLLQLHAHPRTGLCRGRSRAERRNRRGPLRKLSENARRR